MSRRRARNARERLRRWGLRAAEQREIRGRASLAVRLRNELAVRRLLIAALQDTDWEPCFWPPGSS